MLRTIEEKKGGYKQAPVLRTKDQYSQEEIKARRLATRDRAIDALRGGSVERLEKTRPRIPEPNDDPKPKLYRVDWINTKGEHNHRYVAAIDKVIAATLFEKKYAKGQEIKNISINRVPSEWNVRFPVLWDRIGIAIEETRQEEIIAAKKLAAENVKKFGEWAKLWHGFWDTLSKSQEDDYNMWQELRKTKVYEWLAQYMEMWSDIGETKWANRSSFDYLEID